MFAECPVCRAPLSWTYLLRPLGSRWRCAQCGSLLRVDTRRRVLAILLLLVGGFAFMRAGVPGVVMLLLALAIWMPLFLALDRPAVVERCGLRCQTCGYDLRGQVAPRCPECGRELDEHERTLLAGAMSPTVRNRAQRGAWIVVIALILLFVATLLAVGITHYRRGPMRAATRPVATQPASVATRPGGGG